MAPEFKELHQTEERLPAVIASAPAGILEVDLDARVIRCNPAAERTSATVTAFAALPTAWRLWAVAAALRARARSCARRSP